jgi:hypothetical protein
MGLPQIGFYLHLYRAFQNNITMYIVEKHHFSAAPKKLKRVVKGWKKQNI